MGGTRVKGAGEAVNCALRKLLGEADTAEHGHDDEYDEFSDPNAWVPRRSRDTG
ncbi:type II toxin-antitoxin system VapB family antitoxin [Mycobacterium tuberculosis]